MLIFQFRFVPYTAGQSLKRMELQKKKKAKTKII